MEVVQIAKRSLAIGCRRVLRYSVRCVNHITPPWGEASLRRRKLAINTNAGRRSAYEHILALYPITSSSDLNKRISYDDVRKMRFYLTSSVPLLKGVIYALWRRFEIYLASTQVEARFAEGDKLEYFPSQFLEGAKLSLRSLTENLSGWVPESSRLSSPNHEGDQTRDFTCSMESAIVLKKMLSPGLYKKFEEAHLKLADMGLIIKFRMMGIHRVKLLSAFTCCGPKQVLSSTLVPMKAVKGNKVLVPGAMNYSLECESKPYRCVSAGFMDFIVEESNISTLLKSGAMGRGLDSHFLNLGCIHSFDLEFGVDLHRTIHSVEDGSTLGPPIEKLVRRRIVIRLETEYLKTASKFTKWVIADVDNYLQNSIMCDAEDPMIEWMKYRVK